MKKQCVISVFGIVAEAPLGHVFKAGIYFITCRQSLEAVEQVTFWWMQFENLVITRDCASIPLLLTCRLTAYAVGRCIFGVLKKKVEIKNKGEKSIILNARMHYRQPVDAIAIHNCNAIRTCIIQRYPGGSVGTRAKRKTAGNRLCSELDWVN